MQQLTNSRRTCFQRCRREHFYSYEIGRRPLTTANALGFGTLFHIAMEAWWNAWKENQGKGARDPLEDALAALRAAYVDLGDENHEITPYDVARIEALVRGYDVRWTHQMGEIRVIDVETRFVCRMTNPGTGASSRTWELAGKLDVIVEIAGETWIVEHKTTASDIAPEKDYWLRLRIDGQVSTYYEGAAALGHHVVGCIYDVVQKPGHQPYKATPEEKRKLKKDGTPYKSTRLEDETPDDYLARVTDAIATDPHRYYQRGEVVRLDDEIREFQADAWVVAQSMRQGQLYDAHPRNPDACVRYGRFCSYFDVCTGVANIHDDTRFRQTAVVNEELAQGTHAAPKEKVAREDTTDPAN